MAVLLERRPETTRFQTPDVRVRCASERDPRFRIGVIGIGALTPLGLDVNTTFWRMVAGESGISRYDDPLTKIKVAGLVKGFDPVAALKDVLSDNPAKDLARMSRAIQLSLAGSKQALDNVELLNENKKLRDDLPYVRPERVGIVSGTGIGGSLRIADAAQSIREKGRGSGDDLFQMLLERTSSVVSMRLGLRGPVFTVTAACATGNVAIATAAEYIWSGAADIMVAVGVESATNYISLELFRAAGALSRAEDPTTACRPWDKGRRGFIFGEGVGVLVLARMDIAQLSGFPIHAEFFGHGEAGDAYHDTAPHPDADGEIRAMRRALAFVPEENLEGEILGDSHATSTLRGDETEAVAYKVVFSREQLERTTIVAPKGALSHQMGAAGTVEAIVGIRSMNERVIFPNVNLDDPIPEIEGLQVPTQPVRKKTDLIINNSFGFGGINASTTFGPYKGK